jgi:hypothetical protein
MMFNIEKNVPFPGCKIHGHSKSKMMREAVKDMEIGDSFLYPLGWDISLFSNAVKHTGKTFTRKKDRETSQYRIWRVA